MSRDTSMSTHSIFFFNMSSCCPPVPCLACRSFSLEISVVPQLSSYFLVQPQLIHKIFLPISQLALFQAMCPSLFLVCLFFFRVPPQWQLVSQYNLHQMPSLCQFPISMTCSEFIPKIISHMWILFSVESKQIISYRYSPVYQLINK